jgi:hypothetical protein
MSGDKSTPRPHVRGALGSGPSHGMQETRVEPASRRRASCMGEGPDAFYQLRWAGCAQDDDCRCSGQWRPFGRGRQLGAFANRADVLRKMVERLERRGGQLRFCYEAGPCGYTPHRPLTGLGHTCAVMAPSLIPIKVGDRIKTDRRCWRGRTARANSPKFGFRTRAMKRCATWCEPARRRQGRCPRRASTWVDFSCDTGRSIPVFEPGRKLIAAG